MKYIRKVTFTDAAHWTGDIHTDKLFAEAMLEGYMYVLKGTWYVKTPSGSVLIEEGDYLIKRSYYDWYPCKEHVFISLYTQLMYSPNDEMAFGDVIFALKSGRRAARKGWNGKGIFIKLQEPSVDSSMTSPFIYIDTTCLLTENNRAPKSTVPWLASQTDMLSDDWIILED